MPYLKLENLNKKLDNFCVRIPQLSIEKGMFFGILGHSGAGKSTLLNLICGLEEMQEGSLYLEGEDISIKPANQRDMAYVFQDAFLFEGLSVKENLEYILKAKGERFSLSRIQESLNECEVGGFENRDVNSLSGGERQRVALAIALMLRPKVLLLDEPFSSLDTVLKTKMRSFLKGLVKKHGITTLMVSHDKDDAFFLFDETVLLHRGEAIQIGTPKQMYESPNSLAVAEYFAIENILHGSIQNGMFYGEKLHLEVDFPDTKSCTLIIPAFAIKQSSENEGKKYALQNQIYKEGRWRVELENSLVLYMQNRAQREVCISIDTSRCTLLEEQGC